MDIGVEIAYREETTSYYNHSTETIGLGGEFFLAKQILSPKEFDIMLSDIITHEFMHGLLEKMFTYKVVSKLFDTVEHYFCDIELKRKFWDEYNETMDRDIRLWSTAIEQQGIQWLYDKFYIDNDQLNQAYIITGGT